MGALKLVEWVASSLADLRAFPEDVRRAFGQDLFEAQLGGKHPAAKPLKGFRGAEVLEVVHLARRLHGEAGRRGLCAPCLPEEIEAGHRHAAARTGSHPPALAHGGGTA